MESILFSFALHLDCSFYCLLHILSHCSPTELCVIVGSDREICTLASHMKEKGLFRLLTSQERKYRELWKSLCGKVPHYFYFSLTV